eukprot:m.254431 g.254431  ORF g.254431 m.254431 type:complete len:1047 (+) comp26731_c0_seq15:89-3229(+)
MTPVIICCFAVLLYSAPVSPSCIGPPCDERTSECVELINNAHTCKCKPGFVSSPDGLVCRATPPCSSPVLEFPEDGSWWDMFLLTNISTHSFTSVSYCAWYLVDDTSLPSTTLSVFGALNNAAQQLLYTFGTTTDDACLTHFGAVSTHSCEASEIATPRVWQHRCVVLPSGHRYINGGLARIASVPDATISLDAFGLGSDFNPSEAADVADGFSSSKVYEGLISQFFLWDTALTANDILAVVGGSLSVAITNIILQPSDFHTPMGAASVTKKTECYTLFKLNVDAVFTSSTSSGTGDALIDGNLNSNFTNGGSCWTPESADLQAMVRVSLRDGLQEIAGVTLVNRVDCCATSSTTFQVYVEHGRLSQKCHTPITQLGQHSTNASTTIMCENGPLFGSRVRVELPAQTPGLCEIQVLGYCPTLVVSTNHSALGELAGEYTIDNTEYQDHVSFTLQPFSFHIYYYIPQKRWLLHSDLDQNHWLYVDFSRSSELPPLKNWIRWPGEVLGNQFELTCKSPDIDECTIGADNCHIQADCINTVGSFNCVCKPGFIGDGVSCSDFDACLDFQCHPQATCTDIFGGDISELGRTCTCNPGFYGDGVLFCDSCASTNPCFPKISVCEANGTSPPCRCLPGFAGPPSINGSSCQPCNGQTEYSSQAGQEFCSPMQVCGPGTHASAGSSTTNQICSDCGPGTYQDETNQRNCKLVGRPCVVGTVEIQAATPTSDRICSVMTMTMTTTNSTTPTTTTTPTAAPTTTTPTAAPTTTTTSTTSSTTLASTTPTAAKLSTTTIRRGTVESSVSKTTPVQLSSLSPTQQTSASVSESGVTSSHLSAQPPSVTPPGNTNLKTEATTVIGGTEIPNTATPTDTVTIAASSSSSSSSSMMMIIIIAVVVAVLLLGLLVGLIMYKRTRSGQVQTFKIDKETVPVTVNPLFTGKSSNQAEPKPASNALYVESQPQYVVVPDSDDMRNYAVPVTPYQTLGNHQLYGTTDTDALPTSDQHVYETSVADYLAPVVVGGDYSMLQEHATYSSGSVDQPYDTVNPEHATWS